MISEILFQVNDKSFARPEYFEKRLIYSVDKDDKRVIANYDQLSFSIKKALDTLLQDFPGSSSIYINNDKDLVLSYMDGLKVISSENKDQYSIPVLIKVNNVINAIKAFENI